LQQKLSSRHTKHEKSEEMAKKPQFVLASATKKNEKAAADKTHEWIGLDLFGINQL
jgi:hypothetical protein